MQNSGQPESMSELSRRVKSKWDRERINKAAKEAYRKAQEENEKMPAEDKTRIEEDEKEAEERAEDFGKESAESKASTDRPKESSFADDDQQSDPRAGNEEQEDLSMFERNLHLPEEGAMCIDSNLQAAKYMVIYLMKRVHKGMNTWYTYNIALSRKEKLKLWKDGHRPDVTGSDYPQKNIDPLTGEPEILTGLEYLEWMRNHGKYYEHVDGNESIIVRSYTMQTFIHKLRWAIYRIGLGQEDVNAVIRHNKDQVEAQKHRRAWLGGSARLVEGIVIQNDPSYTTMCKLNKMVAGCESFSMLSAQRSSDRHLSIDMEALVGDSLVNKGDVDQELVLIMNQYGLNNFLGPARMMLQNLKDGKSFLSRQLIENEDYTLYIPQLRNTPQQSNYPQGKGVQGSDHRPKGSGEKGKSKYPKGPTVYGPGGKSYDLPPRESSDSSQVGANAKAHAAKARPDSSRPQPPDPPPSPRMQEEARRGSATYAGDQEAANDPGQSSQQPIDPNPNEKGRGKGRGRHHDRDDQWGHRGRGGKGCRYPGGWEYHGYRW